MITVGPGCEHSSGPSREPVILEVVAVSDCGGFPNSIRPSDVWPSESGLLWEFDGYSTLTLYHLNAAVNCCTRFEATLESNGNHIVVRESESGDSCRCACLRDIHYRLHSVDYGPYSIAIEESHVPYGSTHIDMEIELYPGAHGGALVERYGPPYGYRIPYPTDNRIEFRVFEQRGSTEDPHDPEVTLALTTEHDYPCAGWGLAAWLSFGGTARECYIGGLVVPDECTAPPAPATKVLHLPVSPGKYELMIALLAIGNTYQLTVTPGYLAVEGDETDYTRPLERLCWRHPPNSFAVLCGTGTEDAWLCAAFIDSLTANLPLSEHTFPDSGVIPYPISSSGYAVDSPARYFIYVDQEDWAAAGEVLRRFTAVHLTGREESGISLTNWRGEAFHSRLVD